MCVCVLYNGYRFSSSVIMDYNVCLYILWCGIILSRAVCQHLEMSPTEPHIYLNLDDVQSLFSDELLSSRASQTHWHDSCRRVRPFLFSAKHYFKESKDTRGQVYKKQSTNFIILSLQRHEPLHPQNISFKKQTRKIDFRWPYTDRRDGKGSDQRTQGIPTI